MVTTNTNTKKLKRGVNTTDTVDTQKSVKKNISHNYIQVNFLIIRELFKLLKVKSIYMYSFYNTIIKGHTPETIYDRLCTSGDGDYKKKAEDLTLKYDIPIDYFAERYITADPSIIDALNNFLNCNNSNKEESKYKKYCLNIAKDKILKNIFTIKNPDGSLLIDKINDIHIDLLKNKNNYADPDSYMILESIVRKYPSSYYVKKDLKNFYINLASEYQKNKNNFTLPDTLKFAKKTTPPKKHLATAKPDNFNLRNNLLLIREFYLFFAKLDGVSNALDNFYNILDIKSEDYDKMIRGGYIDCLDLAEKFEKFKYSSSYFRTDHATKVYTSKLLKNTLMEYDKTYDLTWFHDILKFELCYRINSQYLPIVVATYSLISHIKLFIELGSNKEVYDNYLQLNSDPTFLD